MVIVVELNLIYGEEIDGLEIDLEEIFYFRIIILLFSWNWFIYVIKVFSNVNSLSKKVNEWIKEI